MGMFDYVRSETPLPDGFTGELQSKDFDCTMTEIIIRESGRLEIEHFDYETVPKEERPYPDREGIMGMCGMLRKVNRHWVDLDYHGDFNFYGYDSDKVWHEYIARFSSGQLDWIRVVPGDPS